MSSWPLWHDKNPEWMACNKMCLVSKYRLHKAGYLHVH